MTKFYALVYLLLVLFVITSVTRMVPAVNAKECRLATIGGGCPNADECAKTCSTCYRNVGRVRSYCSFAGGDIPYDQCFCVMSDGAPCMPVGPPKCPDWPRSTAVTATNFTAN